MASLNNPINPQNIVDRFSDYVTATANSGISWGTNAYPFGEFDGGYFGGDTNGRGISVNGGSIAGIGQNISAAGIYNTLVNETASYTNIRNLRALLFVDGGGGNTGSRGSPGYIYDGTAVAHMNGNYRQGIGSPGGSDLSAGNNITAGGLEGFFDTLRATYNAYRGSTVQVQINVCHASCHSSCHGSRGRR